MKYRRFLVFAFGFLVALLLSHAVIITVALQMNLPGRLTRGADKLRLSCDGGYSLWPGVIHLDGLDLVIQDYNITMQIEAESAAIDLGLFSLLSGTIHMEDVEASGGKVKMRHRVADAAKSRSRIALFPPIFGFERPIQFPSGPRVWGKQRKVVVDHIKAQATDLWFVEYKMQGEFVAEGAFTLDSQVRLEPTWMKAKNVRVLHGERPIGSLKSWDLSMDLGPFPRRRAKLGEVVATLSARSKLDLLVEELDLLELYMKDSALSWSGRAAIEGDFSIVDGQGRSGTLTLSSQRLHVDVNQLPVDLSANAQISVHGAGLVDFEGQVSTSKSAKFGRLQQARVELALSHDDLGTWQLKEAGLSIEHLVLDAPDTFRRATGSSSVPLINVHDLSGKLNYSVAEDTDSLSADLDVQGTWFPSPEQQVGLDAELDVACAMDSKGSERALDCSSIRGQVRRLALRNSQGTSNLALRFAARDFSAKPDLRSIDSTFELSGENPKPFLMDALGKKHLAKVGLFVVPLDDWSALLHLNRSQTTWAGQIERFQAGALQVQGRFVADQALESAWLVSTPLGRYGLRTTAGGVSVHPLVSKNWMETCKARLGEDC